MQLYLIILPLLYLIVSYLTIFRMNKKITDILRIIMSILLLITVVLTLIQFSMSALWIGLVLLLLIGNVEITAFKNHKGDRKGVTILNLMTIMATVIYILLVIFALR